MSIAGAGVAVVSLGVTCEAAAQIRHHAPLISRLCGAEMKAEGAVFHDSAFPFDWRLVRPEAFCEMARAGQYFPASPDEVDHLTGETLPYCRPPLWEQRAPEWWEIENEKALIASGTVAARPPWKRVAPLWRARRVLHWHDFFTHPNHWDVPATFAETAAKFAHLTRKFLGLTGRAVFVLQNSQCALDEFAALAGVPVTLSANDARAVLETLRALFTALEPELIVVSRRDRIEGDLTGWPCPLYLINPSNLDACDVIGDAEQWGRVFTEYFARGFVGGPVELRAAPRARPSASTSLVPFDLDQSQGPLPSRLNPSGPSVESDNVRRHQTNEHDAVPNAGWRNRQSRFFANDTTVC